MPHGKQITRTAGSTVQPRLRSDGSRNAGSPQNQERQEDTEHADAVIRKLQLELASVSQELAETKYVFAKAQGDLGQVHADISALRTERNKLVKKLAAYEAERTAAATERNRLNKELARLKSAFEQVTRERHRLAGELPKQARMYERKLAADLAERQQLHAELRALRGEPAEGSE